MRRNPRRTESLLVCAAVKKMARRNVDQSVQKFLTKPILASVATWDNDQEIPDACILVGCVPRMRLCSSLFIVKGTLSSNTSEDLSFQKKKKFRTQNSELRTQNQKKN